MQINVLSQVRQLLSDSGVAYREIEHAPTLTSEDSARIRGESLSVGAKALVVKTDNLFRLFVLPADRQFDARLVKQQLGVRNVRFATKEELTELTGLVPGSVPPFGWPVLPLELYGDATIGATEDKVAFNAGSLTTSIVMSAADWRRIAQPVEFAFAKAQ